MKLMKLNDFIKKVYGSPAINGLQVEYLNVKLCIWDGEVCVVTNGEFCSAEVRITDREDPK